MKKIVFVLYLISLNVFAGVVETEKDFKIDFTGNADALKIYSSLNLPIDFGTLVTGKNHQYKAFQDKDKNFLIYCAEISKKNDQCVIAINKVLNNSDLSLENDDLQIHVQMNDYDQGLALYNALNVPVMKHGTYLIKVLADENNLFGVSCMTDGRTYSEYQCDIRIFK